ncbi:MAG: 3-phosphoshikimate 1-carboxyvinyltransferase, partial [Pseudomonadota bacterium]|nr:3-phosphoshikimate 1-carboxyvinyltransferase [Pseudomonadota bacterium]
EGRRVISLEGGQTLQGCAVDVPADPSSAAFPVVAALLCPESEVDVFGICYNETRNGIYKTLIEMGADIEILRSYDQGGETVVDMRVRGGKTLQGIDVPADRVPSMIDEFPVLAVAAACAEGTTRMVGLEELRVKESDRLALVAKGLAEAGVELEEGTDNLTIHGTGKPPKGGNTVETMHDHRIAMSFLVLGLASEESMHIDDASPIRTSFPNFISLMRGIGATIEADDAASGNNVLRFEGEL